jgi:CelD/BcsL family acetyltransferase involved in cellulose biosynthesis
LKQALAGGIGGWRVMVADRLPGEQGWGGLLGREAFTREPSPVLEAGGMAFDDWLRTRSKNFREQVRRRERKLRKAHEVEFRLTDDPERLDEDLGTLIRLHDARFGDESRSFSGVRRKFHADFARRALERGWLRLWTLELDGGPAAAWMGYRFGGIEWYYQAGRDPALEREAVGFVLMAHTIRSALDDGMSEYRLLLGGEAYKDRFASADHGLETIILARGPLGRSARAAARMAASAPPGLRKRLRRIVG